MTQASAAIDHVAGVEQDVLRAFQDVVQAVRNAEKRAVRQSDEEALPSSESEEPAENQIVQAVRDILLGAVEAFGRRLNDLLPNTGRDPARQATYAATAFVDERMIALKWPGRRPWMDHPLELRFFGTRSGGQDVFRQIDALTGNSMTERALAVIYLCMLDLGFAGQYDPTAESRQLSTYRHFLFKLVMGQEPDPEAAGARMTDPGVPPQQASGVRFIPYLRPWLIAMAGLIFLFLVAGHVTWVLRTAALEREVSRISEEMGY